MIEKYIRFIIPIDIILILIIMLVFSVECKSKKNDEDSIINTTSSIEKALNELESVVESVMSNQ